MQVQAVGGYNITKAEYFTELIAMIADGKVYSRGAKNILEIIHERADSPEEIAKDEGLLQVSDERALLEIGKKVLMENEKVVSDYKSGNEKVLKFLVGQCMKESKGAGNPQGFEKLLKENLLFYDLFCTTRRNRIKCDGRFRRANGDTKLLYYIPVWDNVSVTKIDWIK